MIQRTLCLARAIHACVLIGVAIAGADSWAAEERLPTPPQSGGMMPNWTAIPPQATVPSQATAPPRATAPPQVAVPPPSDSSSRPDDRKFNARYKTVPGMRSRIEYGGGVFEESYFRGLKQPMRSHIEQGGMPQATGWTDYGFPMRPFRWGYFGAEPRRDRMSWHTKYYGDKVKTEYFYGLR